MMNRTYTYIGIVGILIVMAFFAPQEAFACGGPCNPGEPSQGPVIYGNTQSSGYAMPMIYNSSNEAPYSAPVPKIDYSGSFTSPALPTLYGNNGQIISGTTSTNTQATSNNNSGSIFGTLFGNQKVFNSSEKTNISENLNTTLNTKGLALGTTASDTCSENEINYLVLFKNITKDSLTNVAVRMYLPDEVVFKNTTLGNYSQYDHSVTVFLGTLLPGQTGQFIVEGVIKKEINSVARAEMVFTKSNGTQDMIVSYAFQNDQNCTNGSALAGFAGGAGFFPTTLFGWLILSIILCAVIYFARFFKKKNIEETHGHHPVIAH